MDLEALRNHYGGEGNTSRRIAQAERYRDTLYYKHEKSMSFSTFLDNMQKMFNIFEVENEAISEQTKVRMLLKKVQHPQLQDAVGTLRVQHQLEGLTFTEAANHLSAIVSELPDHQSNRKLSAVEKSKVKHVRGGGPGGNLASKRKGIFMPDGSVWTGYYSDWEKMSETDKQTVMDTRKKKKGNTPTKKKAQNDLKAQVAELKRSIAAMQSVPSAGSEDKSDSDSIGDNAGDAFGGRSKKKSKKE
jgi:hypothetical protein